MSFKTVVRFIQYLSLLLVLRSYEKKIIIIIKITQASWERIPKCGRRYTERPITKFPTGCNRSVPELERSE